MTTHASMPRVLLADNAPDNRLLMTLYLRRSGIEILTAQTGEETLQIAATMKPGLLVLDQSVSGMSGYEVCRRIKANPETSPTQVVFVTSSGDRDVRILALQAGADDFFAKPLNRDEFLFRVKSLINQARIDSRGSIDRAARHLSQSAPAQFEHLTPRKVMGADPAPSTQNSTPADFQNRFDAVILFADLRGFTRMAEQLSPAKVVTLLNQFFSLLTDVAYRHNGVIFNMAGDSLLIGFGVPFERKDALTQAVSCGREMLRAFQGLSASWEAEHGLQTGLGIGINKGEVIAGNVGSVGYSNFTIIGDAVNIASRLVQRARSGEMMLSERIVEGLKSANFAIDVIALAPLTLRGRREPISLYCVPAEDRIDTRI
ncbi:MAG: adenylate/guanylate cyclase domain-containing protein [Burkholderiales bacterium]